MNLRRVSVDDIELLIRLRIDYLIEERGNLYPDEKEKIQEQLHYYFPKHISDGTFIGVIAESNNEVMCVAYLAISEKPANPSFLTGKTGTLLNVLTYPQYRRQGIAIKVINKILDEAKRYGISHIDLLATNEGKPLYEKIGFHVSKYTTMGITIV